jgi:hypothetical protein
MTDNGPMPLNRIAWAGTVVVCLLTGILLLLAGYQGYAGVAGAVGASAAINLR